LMLPPGNAKDAPNEGGAANTGNVGFMRDPPQAIRDRFPMCQAFLDVQWIDERKQIGYLQFDALLMQDRGTKGEPGTSRTFAIVDLNEFVFDYDVSYYESEGRLEALFEAIRRGNVSAHGVEMFIDYQGKNFHLNTSSAPYYTEGQPLLDDHRRTVCLVYPDGRKAWIVEGRSVNHTYQGATKETMLPKIMAAGKDLSVHSVGSMWVLDINFDGIDDYVSRGSLIYTRNGKLYETLRKQERPGGKYIFRFPPKNAVCRSIDKVFYPLITDGKKYYLSNACDLTSLTSDTKE